ncbi:glycoside hydrolase family 1 protein [Bifidobacterium sp.]|jgi:beta-glucosidase|uniref:glycoside hydrolase family 1 protein n=1 Tax=Bifidobacterium sp. TaxID=41200 RepID=UPI0025C27637|nr:family 1 glycosylhydrolase [Bifidobacterium sp.]MCH4209312.1 family 1 glycosylhydrolase [Bifidobacterium sp.]MCI1224106.1 family 1 glycosylhydrolase [Bifidobacterium sp.]
MSTQQQCGYILPEDFLFGAATSPHQTEGSNIHSDWWALETSERSPLAQASGMACDSYHRWRQDMRLLQENGFNAYRFGVEWARIEPEPGVFDEHELDHYHMMVQTAASMGLKPFVTLHHFTSPLWFARQGGWAGPDAINRFGDYVQAVLPVLRDGVAGIVTINEPNMVAIMSSVLSGSAALQPGGLLPDPDPVVARRLVEAHRLAATLVHESLPGVPVGWSVANQCVQSLAGGEAAAAVYSAKVEDYFIRAAKEDDFIGIQAYTRTVIDAQGAKVAVGPDRQTSNGWEYYPQAAAQALMHVHGLLPEMPLVITENGISTIHDEQRIAYTEAALCAVGELMGQGYPVHGYFHWSLLDNYEWGNWQPTFGLAAVDRESGSYERIPKPSLSWLGDWARRAMLPTECRHDAGDDDAEGKE